MKSVVITLLLALTFVAAASAKVGPQPQCYKQAHCTIHWVAYDYDEYGHDQFGNTYVRTCHVSRRGKHTCGNWIYLRSALKSHHAQRP